MLAAAVLLGPATVAAGLAPVRGPAAHEGRVAESGGGAALAAPAGTLTVLIGSLGPPGTDPASGAGAPGVLDDLYAPLLMPAGHAAGALYRWSAGSVPALASSVSHHHGAYTVTLRRGVLGCDGDELVASDVLFALRRAALTAGTAGPLQSWAAWHAAGMLGPPLAEPAGADRGATPGGAAAAITGRVQLGGRFEITLRPARDDGMMAQMLTLAATAPIDGAAVAAHAGPGDPAGLSWLASHDAGFGPYCLASYTPGRSLVLEPNPHWRLAPQPRLRRIVVDAVASPAQRLAELESGSAQVALDLPASELGAAATSRRVRVIADPDTTGHLQLDLDYAATPWGPNGAPRAMLMRRAMAAALPYAAIVAALGAGGAQWQGEIPPAVPGAERDQRAFSTDDAAAATDLAAAGHPGGVGVPSSGLVLSFDAGAPSEAAIAALIEAALAKLGVDITLQPVPSASFTTSQIGTDAMAIVRGGGTFADAAWYSERWYAAPAAGGELNLDGYDDPDLNALATESASVSGAARAALARREQAIELADLPVIPLALLVPSAVVADSVRSMSLAGPGPLWAVTSLHHRAARHARAPAARR
jgi:ABC-type transport system substrate-binding protein